LLGPQFSGRFDQMSESMTLHFLGEGRRLAGHFQTHFQVAVGISSRHPVFKEIMKCVLLVGIKPGHFGNPRDTPRAIFGESGNLNDQMNGRGDLSPRHIDGQLHNRFQR